MNHDGPKLPGYRVRFFPIRRRVQHAFPVLEFSYVPCDSGSCRGGGVSMRRESPQFQAQVTTRHVDGVARNNRSTMKQLSESPTVETTLRKAPTGIRGLDEITLGGLPRGRTTLVCGAAGCGKTLLGMEFLVRGVIEFGEPGVLISFEEKAEELMENVASLGFDVSALTDSGRMAIDYVHVERSEIEETGEYDLEGLFVRLAYAIESVGAKRIVLDTLETLFSALGNEAVLRAELRRLFRWLKDRQLTAVITGERGDGTLTRYGLEEYVSDCVILLEQRVYEQVATRQLRVVKYRGTSHGTNEYPFLIDRQGISVLPVTSVNLVHVASDERMPTGISGLDAMLDDKGFYRGSSVLISGKAGTGKTSLAAHTVFAAIQRGERCVYFTFEESQSQFIRNMRSIGLDFQPAIDAELLRFFAARPTAFGLEMHLAMLHREIDAFEPTVVVVDPLTNFVNVGNRHEVRSMLMRLIDFLKCRGVTAILTTLTSGSNEQEDQTEVGISSLADTWLLVRFLEGSGERNRGLYVLKSRGMPHSNQIREFRFRPEGIELIPAYTGAGGVLTGAARYVQESKDKAEVLMREREIERKRRELERKRALLEAQVLALRTEFEAEELDILQTIGEDQHAASNALLERDARARLRWAEPSKGSGEGV